MRVVVGLVFLVHGFAHLVGFVVPWRLMKLQDAAYKTTLVGGRIDVGDVGIRIVGILWLVAGIAFAVAGIGSITLQAWWRHLALLAAAFSLVLSILGWPEARIGIVVNLAIVGFMLLAPRFG
ncbi:MAG TPA: ABC transporter permease [Candidatus Tectomicrobia bacterium]|jgi:hypothetical protein